MKLRTESLLRDITVPALMTMLLLLSLFGGFLLYHSLAELFSIIVAYLAFVVAGYTYRYSHNHFLMFLGIVFFWTGSLDLVHALTYKGVHVFHGLSANTPTQYWIAARLLAAVSFLVSPLFFRHHLPVYSTFVIYGLISTLIAISIATGYFPDAYIEGMGLTPFKIYSEYTIIAILLVTLGIFISMRHYIESGIYWSMVAVIILTMLTEVVFTLYVSLVGFTMILGHLLKFFAFWMVFQAMVRTTLMKPFAAMSRTSSTYDAIPEPTVLVDQRGIIQQCNDATYNAIGLPMSGIVGRNVHELFHDPRESAGACLICEDIRQLRSLKRSEVHHHKLWYRISLAPVNVQGTAVGMVHVAHDITERMRANERLRNSEERFRQLAENINEVFWLTDPDAQKVLYISPAFERIWGRPVNDAYKNPMAFLEAIHPLDVTTVEDAFSRQAEGKYDEFYRVVQPDGSLRWVRDRAFPIRDEDGKVYRIAGIATDITQQVEAEDAKRSSQAKTEFLSRMSHELRTPLTAVLGFSQLLESQSEQLSQEQRDFVDEIYRAGNHLLSLVNDVLDLSRIESGRLKVELERVYLNEVVQECISLVQPLAQKSEVILEKAIGKDEELWVMSDWTRIKQVLINLLNNAVKYNRPQGHVDISAQRLEGGNIRISVRDTGMGMTQDEMEKIFEPFFRLNPELGTDGVGIGLTLTRYLVELMNGEIGVESEPGVGSHFWVTLQSA